MSKTGEFRPKPLSKREHDLAILLKAGLKSKDAAKELGLNQKTIGTYLDRIYKKCGVGKDRNLYYVIKKADELGLLKQ